MNERWTRIYNYRVTMPCGRTCYGNMEATGLCNPADPPTYSHCCTACKRVDYYPKQYPSAEYRDEP